MKTTRLNLEEEIIFLTDEVRKMNEQLKRLRKTNSRLRRQSRTDKNTINKLREALKGKEKQQYRNGKRGTIKHR